MNAKQIAILIYGDVQSGRNALAEDKYRDLATAFSSQCFSVASVLYNDATAGILADELICFDAVLVWVNPIEQGNNRNRLDALLTEIAGKGCFVSTHPEVILKMGTKEVLYTTKDMGWGSDTKLYTSYEDFTGRFPGSLQSAGTRILKQYRGNGGNGVFKIKLSHGNEVTVTHAIAGHEKRVLSFNDFFNEFKPFFSNQGMLIDQEWNQHIINGMVRCYVAGTKVAGFGYQEINALYETKDNNYLPPGKRFYFTENCGLFNDLKEIMEKTWIPQLQHTLSIDDNRMPVIWDADFFINHINGSNAVGKYTLCEINVSCVSPFPPSAIQFIVDEVGNRIKKTID